MLPSSAVVKAADCMFDLFEPHLLLKNSFIVAASTTAAAAGKLPAMPPTAVTDVGEAFLGQPGTLVAGQQRVMIAPGNAVPAAAFRRPTHDAFGDHLQVLGVLGAAEKAFAARLPPTLLQLGR